MHIRSEKLMDKSIAMNCATPSATYQFAKKFSHYKDFYAKSNDLIFSKLGLGTFNKEPYKEENYVFHYIEGVKQAIRSGINLIDTASNYRYGESEKEIGEALRELFESGEVGREELIICSKGGFIPLCYPFPKNPYVWIEENILKPKLASKEEIELDQHCMSPDFLEYSCRGSLERLGVDALDIYFLHNPEMQLKRLGKKAFYEAIEKIFERFELLRAQGLFHYYGVATWNAFLLDETHEEHISLERLMDAAQKVGGKEHGFRYIQAPFNLAKTHAYTLQTQKVKGEACTLMQAAKRVGVDMIGSSSLLQMNLFKKSFTPEVGFILDKQMILKNDIQLALQFVRSTRGILSGLFASKVPVHIKENVEIGKISATPQNLYDLLYKV